MDQLELIWIVMAASYYDIDIHHRQQQYQQQQTRWVCVVMTEMKTVAVLAVAGVQKGDGSVYSGSGERGETIRLVGCC